MRSVRSITLGFLVLLALAALVVPASAGAAGADVPLVRMRDGHGSDLLFRLNPRTLQQVGRPIRTFRVGAGLAFSPDNRRIAYSGSLRGRSGIRSGIHFVDLAAWRSLGKARLGRFEQASVAWVSPDRVVAATQESASRLRIRWIDVRTRKVVTRRRLSGWAMDWVPVPGGLVLPLMPREGLGALRLALADPWGGLHTIELDGIRAGSDSDKPGGRFLTPAVAADPDGGRVYVVAAHGLLAAEVDLASGAVSYHSLGAGASKGDVDIWWRTAAWAGDGRIAVTGAHWLPMDGKRAPDGPLPFGVRIIDVRNWSIATLDPRAFTMHVAGATLLATGTRWFDGGRRSVSTGLLAFDQDGRRVFTRFRGRPVSLLGSRGALGYAWIRRTRTAHVIDLDSGRTLHTIRTGNRIPFLLSP
jgi:hypothetical protein